MKSFLKALFCAVLISLLIFLGLFCYVFTKGPKLDASSKGYVDANVPAIISTWSKDELKKRASKRLTADLTDQQWATFVSQVSPLGKYQGYKGSEGQTYVNWSLQHGQVMTAAYTVRANYQNAQAEFNVTLIWQNNHWLVSGLWEKSATLFDKGPESTVAGDAKTPTTSKAQ